jgi:hypothetical protein
MTDSPFLPKPGPKRRAAIVVGSLSLAALGVVLVPTWLRFPLSAWRLSTFITVALFSVPSLAMVLIECLRIASTRVARLNDDTYFIWFGLAMLGFANITFGGLVALVKLRVLAF